MRKTTYRVTREAWLYGALRPAGSTLPLAAAEAEFYVRNGTLVPVDTAPAAAPVDEADDG